MSLAITHELGNRIISSIPAISQILQEEKMDNRWVGLMEDELTRFERGNRLSLLSWIRSAATDIARYLKYFLIQRSGNSSDYCFFITNTKFYGYTEGIRNQLKAQGNTVQYLFWNPADARALGLSNEELISFGLPFPRIWSREYRCFRTFCTMEDRAAGCRLAIAGRKTMFVEGCLLEHHMLAHYLRMDKIPTTCLQWGYFGKSATKMGWRRMPFDRFLVWGDFFRSEFQRYSPDLPIRIVGHPRLREQNGGDSGKVILFAMQRVMEQHITASDLETFYRLSVSFAKARSDYEVRVRSHPDFPIPASWKSSSLSNLLWQDYDKYTINESLAGTRYCVSISSTLSLEAVSYGCYPVYVKLTPVDLQIHGTVEGLSGGRHCFTPNDLFEGIHALDNEMGTKRIASIRRYLFHALGDQAIQNTVAALLDKD